MEEWKTYRRGETKGRKEREYKGKESEERRTLRRRRRRRRRREG